MKAPPPPVAFSSCFYFEVSQELLSCVQDQLWTDASSRAVARRLQEALLRAGGWRDSAHLLTGDPGLEESENQGILGKVLDFLQPQMTKLVCFYGGFPPYVGTNLDGTFIGVCVCVCVLQNLVAVV